MGEGTGGVKEVRVRRPCGVWRVAPGVRFVKAASSQGVAWAAPRMKHIFWGGALEGVIVAGMG